jgi:hypothetical protein
MGDLLWILESWVGKKKLLRKGFKRNQRLGHHLEGKKVGWGTQLGKGA